MRPMKITIITVSYNSAATIGETLQSLRAQDKENYELESIVIDGGSTDGTQEIIEDYSDVVTKWVSERDNGIYNAMNKGLALATGDVIGCLNSDDVLAGPSILTGISAKFQEDDRCQVVFGDLDYVNERGEVVRRWRTGIQKSFVAGWHPAHPAFYARRETFEKADGFDESFLIGSDFDLMLRFLEKEKFAAAYLPLVMVKMKLGGVSNNSWKNRFILKREYERSFNKYDIVPIRGYIYVRWFCKFLQYWR